MDSPSFHLKSSPSCPETPWTFSPEIMKRLTKNKQLGCQTAELLPDDPEACWILERLITDMPLGDCIRKITCIYNESLQQRFTEHLYVCEETGKRLYDPYGEPTSEEKTQLMKQWKNLKQPLFSLSYIGKTGKREPLVHTKVFPLWCASSVRELRTIVSSGFSHFGRDRSNKQNIGQGIYFTDSIRAASLSGERFLLLNLVSMGEPYLVDGEKPLSLYKQMGPYGNHDAHFIPADANLLQGTGKSNRKSTNQFLLFQTDQMLPSVIVTIEPNKIEPTIFRNTIHTNSCDDCYSACQKGELDRVKQWIAGHPARLYAKNETGENLLFAAILGEQVELFQWLCNQDPKGSLLKARRKDGLSALELAAPKGDAKIKKSLLEKIAHASSPDLLRSILHVWKSLHDEDNSWKNRLLRHAAHRGKLDQVKLLLKEGALIDETDKWQRTALYLATMKGHPATVEYLLQMDADPALADTSGTTPLHVAAENGYCVIAEFLVRAGAPVNAMDKHHDLPFDRALVRRDEAFLSYFLGDQPPEKKRQWFCMIYSALNQSHQYAWNGEWSLAATILNDALIILENQLDQPYYKTYLLEKLLDIKTSFLVRIEKEKELVLSKERERLAKKRFTLPEKQTTSALLSSRSSGMKITQVLKELTTHYRKLLATLIEDALLLFGKFPVACACIGMGPIARNEICIGSPIEFAFLIEEDTEEAINYFQQLAQFLNLSLINLGHTKFTIDETSRFHKDAACLIYTPKQLVEFIYTDEPEDNGHLIHLLSSVCLISGQPALIEQYCTEKKEHLNKDEGFFSFLNSSEPPLRETLALQLFEWHIATFTLNPNKKIPKDRPFNIQNELYRPLQSMIAILTLFFGKESTSSFDTLEQLKKEGQLPADLLTKITSALSCVFSLLFEFHLLNQNHAMSDMNEEGLFFNEEQQQSIKELYELLLLFELKGKEMLQAKGKFVDSNDSPNAQEEMLNIRMERTKNRRVIPYERLHELGYEEDPVGSSDWKDRPSEKGKGSEAQKVKENQVQGSVIQVLEENELKPMQDAILFHLRVMTIWLSIFRDPTDPHLAKLLTSTKEHYTRIGKVYDAKEKHTEEEKCFQAALQILQNQAKKGAGEKISKELAELFENYYRPKRAVVEKINKPTEENKSVPKSSEKESDKIETAAKKPTNFLHLFDTPKKSTPQENTPKENALIENRPIETTSTSPSTILMKQLPPRSIAELTERLNSRPKSLPKEDEKREIAPKQSDALPHSLDKSKEKTAKTNTPIDSTPKSLSTIIMKQLSPRSTSELKNTKKIEEKSSTPETSQTAPILEKPVAHQTSNQDADTLKDLCTAADAHFLGERYKEAIACYQEDLKSLPEVTKENFSKFVPIYMKLAKSHAACKEKELAIEYATKTLETQQTYLPEKHYQITVTEQYISYLKKYYSQNAIQINNNKIDDEKNKQSTRATSGNNTGQIESDLQKCKDLESAGISEKNCKEYISCNMKLAKSYANQRMGEEAIKHAEITLRTQRQFNSPPFQIKNSEGYIKSLKRLSLSRQPHTINNTKPSDTKRNDDQIRKMSSTDTLLKPVLRKVSKSVNTFTKK